MESRCGQREVKFKPFQETFEDRGNLWTYINAVEKFYEPGNPWNRRLSPVSV